MNRIDRGDETLDQQYSTLWSRHDGGQEPSVADFLAAHPDTSSSERSDVLLADQWLRWRSGCPKTIGDYLAEHPSLADDPEAVLKLVQGEFLARLDRGETPEPEAYARMFPALAEPILLQCEVDRWLTMPAPTEPSMSMATTADYPIGDAARADTNATDDDTRPDSTSGHPAALEAPLPEADFELVRPLGSGGMGEVYEAIQKSLRKRVALKLIRREALDSPSRVRRFFAEARASARLHHPYIVGVHGIGRMADGRYFLVLDLIKDGTTLAVLLKQGPVSFGRAAELVATVAEAIEHAHSRGVVHRDLKPSNVLLDAEGRPHVTDFGLAKIFDATDPDHPPTTADQILGTPHYMTPEQADPARGPIAPRTDVYALGGLLYALLTGKPPIVGDSLTAILTRIVSPEPVSSPRALRVDVPAGLERICATCLEKDAEQRYPSAAKVAEALRAWLANPEMEDCSGATVDTRDRAPASNHDPNTDRARSGWAPDRSLKDGRRTPSPGRWPTKAALSPGLRGRSWAARAGLATLALLLMAVTLVQTSILRRTGRVTRIEVPTDISTQGRQSSPSTTSIDTPPAPARPEAPPEKSPAPPPTVPPVAMARAGSAPAPSTTAPPETRATPEPPPIPTPAPTTERTPGAPTVPAMTLARDAIWDQPEVKRAWDLTHLSTQDEARLGAELHDLILQLNRRSEDGPWQQRVEEAAKPFLKAVGRKDVRYTFTVLESDAVCAFSHPGGYVYVCRGLFDLIGEDEDYALEFAVGHEIAHVDLGHAVKYLRGQDLMRLPLGTLQKLYMILIPFAYPDDAEFEADRWTYSRMRLAGRSAHRSLAFVRKLRGYAEHNGFNNGRIKPKPSTESSLLENHYRAHPATWKRLDQLTDFIAADSGPKR